MRVHPYFLPAVKITVILGNLISVTCLCIYKGFDLQCGALAGGAESAGERPKQHPQRAKMMPGRRPESQRTSPTVMGRWCLLVNETPPLLPKRSISPYPSSKRWLGFLPGGSSRVRVTGQALFLKAQGPSCVPSKPSAQRLSSQPDSCLQPALTFSHTLVGAPG